MKAVLYSALWVACAASLGACSGCSKSAGASTTGADETLTVPASSDPTNADLVDGAILAATEKAGGVRLLKLVKRVRLPPKLGDELRMVAYDAKGADFAEVAKLYKKKAYKPLIEGMHVRLIDFQSRQYRVLAIEPVTDEEKVKAGPS